MVLGTYTFSGVRVNKPSSVGICDPVVEAKGVTTRELTRAQIRDMAARIDNQFKLAHPNVLACGTHGLLNSDRQRTSRVIAKHASGEFDSSHAL